MKQQISDWLANSIRSCYVEFEEDTPVPIYIYIFALILISFIKFPDRISYQIAYTQQFYDIHAKFKQFQTHKIYIYEWMCSNSKTKDSKIVTDHEKAV